jgi:3-oxoacyl-[acyl-carrier-protein] synthase II
MRRVVVTGLGIVSPLGCSVEGVWSRLIASESGIAPITYFDTSDLPAKIAGQVPAADEKDGFKVDDFISVKEQRKMDRFIQFGLVAAEAAIEDAGWKPTAQEDLERTGVMIGSGIGGLNTIAENAVLLHEQGPRRISPFFIPASLINLVSGHVSIKYQFQGPNHSAVTACATSAHALGDAARLIQWGDADVMVAGGAEAAICKLGMAGFAAARALSTNFNDTPTAASRPWDMGRDGFVMGEGAGVVVLEELEHAKRRGAKIYAELTGYGLSGDGYHITAPHPEGRGAMMAMKRALQSAKLDPSAIDYINAHGTSTPLGDEIELGAVKKVFGEYASRISMSSTKSSIGHLLGAAGAVEAIFSVLAMNHGIMPPTLNLDQPSPGCDLDLIPHTAKEKSLTHVLSNGFGFGGTNASLVFSRYA